MRISDWSSDVCSSDLFIDDVQTRKPVGVALRLVDLRVDDHLALGKRPHLAVAVGSERHVWIERTAGAVDAIVVEELQAIRRQARLLGVRHTNADVAAQRTSLEIGLHITANTFSFRS